MKVAIVNDLAVARETLRRIVTADPRYQVVWTAPTGEEAVERCRQAPPDVVLMDLIMPGMDGAEATRQIMKTSPCAVLVVTATVMGNFSLVCQAFNNGAYDAVCTPALGDAPSSSSGAELLRKLESVERVLRSRSAPASPTSSPRPPTPMSAAPAPAAPLAASPTPLVAIGASTGGPAALESILSRWPARIQAAFVIVQHIEMDFAPSLVDWLRDRCKLSVRLAREGDTPQAGLVLIAATNDHLVMLPGQQFGYRPEPRDCPYRPSVDALYHSLVQHWRWPGAAALLTGIGRDGADGLLALRRRGWHTVAQDEATSVVYGMPRAARDTGAVERVLPVDQIADSLAATLRRWYPRAVKEPG